MNKAILLGLIALLLGCTQQVATINSFDDCANAGYPIMESYPRQCKTPDGTNYIEDITNTQSNNTELGNATLGNATLNDTSTNYQVFIRNFQFKPDSLTIKADDTVTWINDDSINHIVASNPHPVHTDLHDFESETLRQGDNYTYTFDKIGTWGYHCHLHSTMTGTISVT